MLIASFDTQLKEMLEMRKEMGHELVETRGIKMSKLSNQFKTMLELQDKLNALVHPEWREQEFNWDVALVVECAELIQHYGYKWWKKEVPDMDQVKLEVVDILHFGLSIILEGWKGPDVYEEIVSRQEVDDFEFKISNHSKGYNVIDATEQILFTLYTQEDFGLKSFMSLAYHAGMTMDEVFKLYIGKNVLNIFRQDHGYKEGTYRKMWLGKEDNEVLTEIMNELEVTDDYYDVLYKKLEDSYNASVIEEK